MQVLEPERKQRPPTTEPPWMPRKEASPIPTAPEVTLPDTRDILKKMRRVDPDNAQRYRQRTGE